MNDYHTPADIMQIESWIDDLALHELATEQIVAMGTAAL
jgi:hypothetical protein